VRAVASLLVLAACAHGPRRPGDAELRVLRIGDAVAIAMLDRGPSFSARRRLPGMIHDRWPDTTPEGMAKFDAQLERKAEELRAIDRASVEGTPAAVVYDLVAEKLETHRLGRVCRTELWAGITPSHTAWHLGISATAEAQPVGDEEARLQAVERFAALPALVEARVATLREGLRRGYSASRRSALDASKQLETMLALPPRRSPFFQPGLRDAELAAPFEKLVRERIVPALGRYRDFLRDGYAPSARDEEGVAHNPDGAACYRARLRANTSLPLDANEVHALGMRELERTEKDLAALSARSFGGLGVRELLAKLRDDPRYRHASREAMLEQARSALSRAQAAMPRAFGILPAAAVVIEPIPDYQEKSVANHYLSPSADGRDPGRYRIRLYEAAGHSRSGGESIAFHETIPGHHLQISIAMREGTPPSLSLFPIAAFNEGWALYAEKLADELGLYSGDVDRAGMLSSHAFRAARLVVDTGLHALGWTRERSVAFLLERTGAPRDVAESEIERYLAWPGQATSYMIGYLELRALREKAERELGPRFDLRAFHDRVLEYGPLPLPVLRRNVERWIVSAAGRG